MGLGDNMRSHVDHFLAYFGVSIASHMPSPNCRSELTPFSHQFLLFFGFFLFMYITINELNVAYNLVRYPWGGRTNKKKILQFKKN